MIKLTKAEREKIDYAMRRFTYDTDIVERTVAEIVEARQAALKTELDGLVHWWSTEYITDDGWPTILAKQLQDKMKKAGLV